MNGRMAKIKRKQALMNNTQQNSVQTLVHAVISDPAAYDTITCHHCGGATFHRVTVIKVIPATHPANPSGRPQNLNLETFMCTACSKLIDERLAASLRDGAADA